MTDIIPFKRPTKPQDLVLRFLNSVGHKRDAEFYLDLFTSAKPESFALVVLDEDVLRDEIDAVLFEIRYLMRLSLFPVVFIRSSDRFLEDLDIESYFKRAKIGMNFLSDEYTNEEKLEFIKDRIKVVQSMSAFIKGFSLGFLFPKKTDQEAETSAPSLEDSFTR